MKKLISLLLLLTIMLGGMSSYASSTTYWLDDHNWTTDDNVISMWVDYKALGWQVEYWYDKTEADKNGAMVYQAYMDAATRSAFSSFTGIVVTGVGTFVNEYFALQLYESIADFASAIGELNCAHAALELARTYTAASSSQLASVTALWKNQLLIIKQYNAKWGTIHMIS